MKRPPLHAIFHRQISGDDALLRLAQARFQEVGVGPEFYPGSPAELRYEQQFNPGGPAGTSTVHLPRNLQVFDRRAHDAILAFAAACSPGVLGLVLHDQPEVVEHPDEYVQAVEALDRRLCQAGLGPMVFIEYACGLEVEPFTQLFQNVRNCTRIGACIDISHIGIRECQREFARGHPELDVCHLKPGHELLPDCVEDVQRACAAALPAVLHAVQSIGALGKPLHFHLHDAHPCSPFSRYGVSDHVSFDRQIPIPFVYRGQRALAPMFGPGGLRAVVAAALNTASAESISLTLEIHAPYPAYNVELGEYESLFDHWTDLTNAEHMNHWLDVLLQNHRLLTGIICDIERGVD